LVVVSRGSEGFFPHFVGKETQDKGSGNHAADVDDGVGVHARSLPQVWPLSRAFPKDFCFSEK
jgi:hypothetical protein